MAEHPNRSMAKKSNPEKKKVTGFTNVAKSIAQKQGISEERARAITAAGAQKASPAAKKANPNLKKVPTKGSKKQNGTFKKK